MGNASTFLNIFILFFQNCFTQFITGFFMADYAKISLINCAYDNEKETHSDTGFCRST